MPSPADMFAAASVPTVVSTPAPTPPVFIPNTMGVPSGPPGIISSTFVPEDAPPAGVPSLAEAPLPPAPVVVPANDVAPPAPALPVAAPVAPALPAAPAAAPAVHHAPVENSTIAGIRKANQAEQAATLKQGDAEEQAQNDLAAQHHIASEKYAQQAEDIRVMRVTQARAQDEAHRQTEDALRAARDKRIPDFWAGREAQRLETAMWQGLAKFGAGLAHRSDDTAEIIQRNVDSYYRREKDKVDNLFKYADAKGQSERDLRAQHQQQLADLQVQYGATKLSIAAKVEEISNLGSAKIDKAKAASLAAKLNADGQKNILNARNIMSEMNLRSAEAARQRQAASEEKEIKPISAEFDKDESRLIGTAGRPGLIAQHSAIRELGNTLRDAVNSGDPTRIKAAIVQNKEKIARLNTGAAPSHEQMKMLNDLSGTPAEVEEKLSSLLGNPKAANQTVSSIMALVDQSDEGALKQIDQARGRVVTKYLGSNGMARTGAQRRHALGRIESLTSGITTRSNGGEVPRYQEGGAPANDNSRTSASSYPVGTIAKQGSKTYRFDGSTWQEVK